MSRQSKLYFTLSCIMQNKVTVSWDQNCPTKTVDTCLIFNESTRIKFIMRTSKLFTTIYENLISTISCKYINIDNVRWLDNDLNPFCYIAFWKYFFNTASSAAPQIYLLGSNPLSTLILWENPFSIVKWIAIIDQNIFPATKFQSPSCVCFTQ